MTLTMNLKPMINGIGKIAEDLKDPLAAAMYAEANLVMGPAKRLVPVKEGILKNSGTVLDPEINDHSVSVEFGFGGAAADYAIKQHEDLTLQHKAGKSAKFLEIPLMQAKDGMGSRIEARMRSGGGAAPEAEE